MQLLKSIFLSLYLMMAFAGIAIGVDQYVHGYPLAALALGLISLSFVLFIAWLFIFPVARTSANPKLVSGIIFIGTVLLGIAFYKQQVEAMSALGFVLALCWWFYIKWYSTFTDRSSAALATGNLLPQMQLEDHTGQSINTSDIMPHKSILMFYRGNWCPICMAQIKELVQVYKKIEAKGIQTILISPQPHNYSKRLADKHNLNFKFLVDKNNSVAKQLDIFSKNGLPTGLQVFGFDSNTVMPTIILTDESGRIIHSDLTSNYRVRPEPEDLLAYF